MNSTTLHATAPNSEVSHSTVANSSLYSGTSYSATPKSTKGNLNMNIVNAAYAKQPHKPSQPAYRKPRSRSPSYSYSDSYSYSYSDRSYSDRSLSRSRSSSRTRRREKPKAKVIDPPVDQETGVTKRLTKAEKRKLKRQKKALKLEIQNEDAMMAEERRKRMQRFQGFSSTTVSPQEPEPTV